MEVTQNDHTNQLHKQITQNNHTREDDVMSKNGNDMMDDAFGCSRATQVCMEDLRMGNLTEIHPSRRGEQLKAPC